MKKVIYYTILSVIAIITGIWIIPALLYAIARDPDFMMAWVIGAAVGWVYIMVELIKYLRRKLCGPSEAEKKKKL